MNGYFFRRYVQFIKTLLALFFLLLKAPETWTTECQNLSCAPHGELPGFNVIPPIPYTSSTYCNDKANRDSHLAFPLKIVEIGQYLIVFGCSLSQETVAKIQNEAGNFSTPVEVVTFIKFLINQCIRTNGAPSLVP